MPPWLIAAILMMIAPMGAVPSDIPDYDRGTWGRWIDVDGDCQDTRQEVLIAESQEPVTFEAARQCRVASGLWTGPFTGKTFTDPSELDVDHVVPLANAHRSGGWAWDEDRRVAYANYLPSAAHLLAVEASANRSKGSRGPEGWSPPLESSWCDYAMDWIAIKSAWGLTATSQAEVDALEGMLATCF